MEKKKAILIVGAISTGIQYVYDVIERGYIPIALYPKKANRSKDQTLYEMERDSAVKRFPAEVIVIRSESNDYESIAKELDDYRIVAVLQGNKDEAELTVRLSAHFGVNGNDPAFISGYTDKYRMQQTLAEQGLNSVACCLCSSFEEAKAFMNTRNLNSIVIKSVSNPGDLKASICSDDRDIAQIFEKGLNAEDPDHTTGKRLLVQECLEGTEYIVNTCSCAGQHMVTDIWRYHKIPPSEGGEGSVYDYAILVRELMPEQEELCRFAMKAIDALGVKYGPTNGEYILTNDGPYLLSLATSPMEPNVKKKFLEKGLSHHITNLAFDSYLKGYYFDYVANLPYEPHGALMFKYFIAQKNQVVLDFPIIPILRKIKSYHSLNIRSKILSMQLEKTVDLDTSSGMLYLASDDEVQIWNDYYLIRALERDYFSLLFSVLDNEEWYYEDGHTWTHEEKTTVLEQLIDKRLNTLILHTGDEPGVVGDPWISESDAVTVIGIEETSRLAGMWNRVIFDFDNRPSTMEEMIEAIFQVSDTLAPGGLALVPGWSIANFPHGKEGLLAILVIADLRINIPRWHSMDMISLTKKEV